MDSSTAGVKVEALSAQVPSKPTPELRSGTKQTFLMLQVSGPLVARVKPLPGPLVGKQMCVYMQELWGLVA